MADVAPGLRCTRCGASVARTRHTRSAWVVGHYVLHGGPTEEATVRRRDDEAALTYRRLVEPVLVIACPACFREPAVQRRWVTFGEEDAA